MAVACQNHLESRIPTTKNGWFPRGNPVRSLASFAPDAPGESACVGKGSISASRLWLKKAWSRCRTSARARTSCAMPICSRRPGVAEKSKLTAEFLRRKVAEYEALTSEVAFTNLKSETEKIVE
jgi:hypothetical protein